MIFQWLDVKKTILSVTHDNGHIVVVENGHPKWDEYSTREDVAEYIPPPPVPPTPEQIAALRRAAYQAESDPIFFKWQRGEATQQEWLDKIEEIRIRYPEPDQ